MIKPRICRICGNTINLVEERENVVWFRDGYTHKSCYVNYYTTKKSPWTEERIRAFLPSVYIPAQEKIDRLISAEEVKQEQQKVRDEKRKFREDKKKKQCERQLKKQAEKQEKEKLEEEKKKLKEEKKKRIYEEQQQKLERSKEREKKRRIAKALADVNEESRKAFLDFIRDTYAPAVVPGRFYARLQKYMYGTEPTYKGNIPPEYFLDMWKKLLPKLNAIDTANKAHGKVIEQRWNYDLAIVLSKYPSYLAWRQKQDEQAQAIRDTNYLQKTQIALPKVNPVVNKPHEEDELDIAAIIDEI